jgi:lysylphosphatidylglycerol synthase-like protein
VSRSAPLSVDRAVGRRALLSYAAEDAGAPTPRLRALIWAGPEASVLAYEHHGGRPLAQRDTGCSDAELSQIWEAAGRLHAHKVTHRGLTADRILLTGDGQAMLLDPGDGDVAASDLQIRLDVAQLIAELALAVGPDRVAGLAVEKMSAGDLVAVVSVLQPVALARPTGKALRRRRDVLPALRTRLLAAVPGGEVTPARLERIRLRLLTLVAAVAAAYLLAGELGRANLQSVLREADWRWTIVALALSAATYVGAAEALIGFVAGRLSFRRTLLAQLASSFVTLVPPAAVGGATLNIRYLQRQKIPAAAAAASVGVAQVVAFVLHVLLILVFAAIAGSSGSEPIQAPPQWAWFVLAGLVLIALVVLAIPAGRRMLRARLSPMLGRAAPEPAPAPGTRPGPGAALPGPWMARQGSPGAMPAGFAGGPPCPCPCCLPAGASPGFRRGFGGEGQELVTSLADHSIARLGHFDPGAGQITDRLRDHQPRVVGHLAQDLPVRILLPEQADVAGEKQRPRPALAGIAERPQALPITGGDRALERVLDTTLPPAGLHEPDRPRHRARRIVLQPETQRQIEQHLGVGSPLDLAKQRLIHRQHQVALDRREAADEPVVHPQPAAMAERMAVRLLHRRPDRRPDVGEEQVRAHMPRQLMQVLVIPGRLDAAEHPRSRGGVIPADTEPVAVGRLRPQLRMQALVDQRMNRGIEHIGEQDRRTRIHQPATHAPLLSAVALGRQAAQPAVSPVCRIRKHGPRAESAAPAHHKRAASRLVRAVGHLNRKLLLAAHLSPFVHRRLTGD